MTRRQLALLILINAILLIAAMSLTDLTMVLLMCVMGANILFIVSLSNQIKADAQRSVLQFKSLSEQQEKNFNVKSAQLETIVSNLPFPMALIDSQGNIILSNPLFHQFALEEAKPNETDTKYFISEVRSFIRNTYISEEASLKSININTIDYQAISVPVYDPKSRYTGCLVMFLDITQILEGERMQKRFIADASHELKTPLSSITGMIQILNRPDFKDEVTRQEFTQQIEQEALRMDNIIQDLLTLSKLSSKAVILELERVALIDLIKGSTIDTRYSIPTKPFSQYEHHMSSSDLPVYWMLEDPIDESRYIFNKTSSQLLTNKRIDAYNHEAIKMLYYSPINIWSSSRLVSQGYNADSRDGYELGSFALDTDSQMLFNLYCNNRLKFNDASCCSQPEAMSLIQQIIFSLFILR